MDKLYKKEYLFDRIATGNEQAYAITGYTCKFTLDDVQYDNVDVCDNNVILFRYAEVLQNYAEAKAELGTLTDCDWSKTIRVVRARYPNLMNPMI